MGVWNLQAQQLSKAPVTVFTDTFETFSGWVTVNSGVVSQSSAQAYEGSFSAIKTTNDDPNGAYKLLNETVSRNYLLEAWIYSVDPRAGGNADRISIVNASGNGYGFSMGISSFSLDTRSSYSATQTSGGSWTKPSNEWYKVSFRAFPDNTFAIYTSNSLGEQLATHTFSTPDNTHLGPFDRVAILGGRNYHIDNLVVKRFDT
jgi:hypothetical protein